MIGFTPVSMTSWTVSWKLLLRFSNISIVNVARLGKVYLSSKYLNNVEALFCLFFQALKTPL